MTALLLIATFTFLFFVGYRFMDCLDHALDNGNLHPYWDSEEEQEGGSMPFGQKKAS